MKLSFKKEKPETGLAAVGNPYANTLIKGDKREVGYIGAPNWKTKDNKWYIRLMVTGGEIGWKWVHFQIRFDSEPEAREWLKKHWKLITTNYSLFQHD